MNEIINFLVGICVITVLGVISLFLCYLGEIKREIEELKEEKDEQRRIQ